jgi:hypothetical protein
MLAASAAKADISASFANVGPVNSGTFRTAANPAGNDTITLAYSIDGTGAVSLDASTNNTNTTFINLVNQFDRPGGTAGSTTNSGFFNMSFSLKVVPVRAGSTIPRLSITTLSGGGLAMEGQNSNRVDGRTLASAETLRFELTAPVGMTLRFKNWSWVDGSNADMRFSTGTSIQNFPNVAASGTANFNLVSNALSLSDGGFLSFGETPDSSNGAGLRGFTFEVLGAPPTDNDVVVSFANSGAGFGPTPPFIGSENVTATITLGFSINELGIISLDASTTPSNATFANMVQEWDRAIVGSVANPELFGKYFTLTGTASAENLNITELGGGGIGIQGENSNRVDGLNYGTGGTTSIPETLTWTLSAPPGLAIDFKSWSYVDGASGDMRISNGTSNRDFPNMVGATGTFALNGLQLGNGDYLAFRELPGVGLTTGAAIGGFSFAVSSLYAPPATGGILLCERWNDTTFYSTSELVAGNRFYGNPDISRHDNPISSSSLYAGSYFSTRARGWITAPETGGYRFWVSGGNAVQLLLSTAGSKYTKRIIAELNPEIGTGHGIRSDSTNLWDNYGSQMSQEIQLTAGQSYYLETVQTIGHTIKAHTSIAWARPNMARTPLEPTCVQPYAPTADDADDDYLPDAWENQYNLDPLDNGFTDLARQGERGDYDGDGLTNREEYLLGTDPTKSDTDGDGASDYAETKQFNTSPLVSDAILGAIVDSPTLANYNPSGTSGAWQMFDGGLIGSSFRGRIEWSFTVPSDGWWIIDLSGQLRGNLRQSEDLALGVSIDSKPLAEHIIHFSNGQPANLRVLSPYLQAGTHTFAVDIRNEIGRRNFHLLALNVLGAGGFDADNNGRPDWLDLMLTRDNQLSPVASESFVSPLFIEGSVRHLGGAEVNSSSPPVTALRGLGDLHWFANVPLNQSGGTSIGVSLETRHQTLTVAWTRWNAMAGQALTIRVGDSVKIGGWLTLEDEGNAVISVNGQNTNLAASGSFVQTFTQPGTYPVTVNHSGGTQATASIHVVAANFGTPATFYSDKLIWRSFPEVPANLKITADPTLAVDITLPEGTGQKAQLRPFRSGPHTLAARLPNGPIVALGNVTSIGVSDALKNDATVSVGFTPDGFQIIRTPIVVTNLPAGGRVVLTIFRAGVTFMDGTTVKTLNASDFVDGVANVDFRFPPNLTGGYCHYIDVYDSENRYLGRR